MRDEIADRLAADAPTSPAAATQLLRVVRAHAEMVCRSRLARSPWLVEDAVQETVIGVWRALPGWEPRRPFLALVSRIATRKVIDLQRRQRDDVSLSDLEMEDVRVWASPERSAVAADRAARVCCAVSTLPLAWQQILTLRFVYGLPATEVGPLIGMGYATVRTGQHRAFNKLRPMLALQESSHG